MNNVSWKHHYLPVFYLKGFTKESGRFKIFNVNKQQYVQKGKEFSPESYFFEKNANTIIKEQGVTDFIESAYSELETKIAKLINAINSSDSSNSFNVTEDDMPMLNMFVSIIYWRLPKNKNELQTIVQNKNPRDLGFTVLNAKDNSVNNKASENLKNDPEFLKAYKFFTALFDSIRGLHCSTPYKIISKHENLPYVCSDNPIIFEKDIPDVHNDDYIFPLSGKRFFIKSENQNTDNANLWLLIDIVIYKQAINYVSCTHIAYLEMLETCFKNYNMSVSELKKEIFKILNKNIA